VGEDIVGEGGDECRDSSELFCRCQREWQARWWHGLEVLLHLAELCGSWLGREVCFMDVCGVVLHACQQRPGEVMGGICDEEEVAGE